MTQTVNPSGTYSGIADVLAVLVLLTEFAMLRAALLRSQMRLYAAQSLVVSVLAAVVAWQRGVPELYVLAELSLALKVIAVPWVVTRQMRRAGTEIAGSGRLGIASEVLLAVVVAAFAFFATSRFHIQSTTLPPAALALGVATVAVSFLLMGVRRDVVSQAVGFFSL
jgi:hydrogenase-4 component E